MNSSPGSKNFRLKEILLAGLLVGTFDIVAACIQFYLKTGKGPEPVLKYIASAVFNKEAYTANGMWVWGLLFHFVIAIAFTALFFWLANKIPVILSNKILTGVIYGIFVWSTMQFLILPFTAISVSLPSLQNALLAIGILVLCIGWPLTFFASRHPSV